MEWHIYALRDPRDQAVRYVGYTKHPHHRLVQHCNTLAPADSPKIAWVLELRKLGLRPVLEVLESTTLGCQDAESRWIEKFRAEGAGLFNIARGSSPATGMGALKSERCSKGHLLSEANVYQRANGTRECKLCSMARAEESRRSKGVKPRRQPDSTGSEKVTGYFSRRAAESQSKPDRKYVPLDENL